MPQVTLTVNGKQHTVAVEGRTLLVELLREKLALTGTHVGCDTSQCGACVVHVNGEAMKSCTMLAVQADGAKVTTIEGLAAADGTLHPMQEMFREHHALQCGFCTPGMVMSAIDLVMANPQGLSEDEIRAAGGQSLPLHRLSQHRQGDRGGTSADARQGRRIGQSGVRRGLGLAWVRPAVMAAAGPPPRSRHHRVPAGPPSRHVTVAQPAPQHQGRHRHGL